MHLIDKWKSLLEYKSNKISPVPEEEWERVSKMLEFTERATLNKDIPEGDITGIWEEEKKHKGYFYQTHDYCIWGHNRARIELPRVRKEYKNLTLDDLFIRYL